MSSQGQIGYLTQLLAAMRQPQAESPTSAVDEDLISVNVQPYDADLVAIAALSGTSGLLRKTGLNTWTLDNSNYITTVTNSQVIAALGYTPVTDARTLTINGVTYDLTANRSWTIAGGVTSFNTRTGAITLLSSDITSTLGYTPYNASNPAGYISSFTETDPTVGSHIKAITTTNISNWNTAYGWGNHALAGYLTGITSGQVTTALGYTPENLANKGVANGYASLDGSGLVPSTQLPSYVDDVLEYTNLAGFPGTGTTGKIYVALDTNKIYRWSGSAYIEVSPTVGTIWGGITGTLANQTDLQTALDAKVPTVRTLTINGTTFDLSANRSWTINSMVYPSAGIAVSTGTAWATSITDNSANWNTAFSWGNHAVAGYLLSSTASSTYLTISNAASTYLTISNAASTYLTSANATSTYQPLDADLTAIAGLAGTSGFLKKTAANTWSLDTNTYLTSFTETDPTVASHIKAITATQISNWDTAFGWGNHASAGYLTSSVAATTYVPQTRTLTINGTTFDLTANRSWTISAGSSALSALSDVTITSVANGQLLQYSSASSKWVNWTANYLTSYTETDTLASVTGRGNSTTSSITVAGLTVNTNPFNLNTYIKGAAAGFIVNDNADTANNFGVTDSGNVRVYRGSLTIGSVVGTGTGTLYAGSIIKSGGTSAQFLKADGSVDSTAYYAASNPSGYTTNTGTVTSVSGTGTVSGLTLTGTVTGSGSLTLGGTLTLTSGQVTTALGYTPYNSTNPSGYTTNTGTVTSVAALTLGTTGTDLSSSVATGTTTPVITLNVPTASAANRGALSSTDWSTFNNKQATITLTTTGSSGSATFSSNTLNVPTYTLSGLGGQPLATNLTSIAALSYVSTSFVKMTAAGTFALDTNTYYLASNPSGYTTNTGTVTSVSGTGTVSGLTLTGTVTTSGSLTLGGTLSLTSGQVTTALGYTPYNSTNPNGYITSSGSISGNAATASSTPKVSTPDLRSTNLTPSYFGQGLNTAFMGNSTDGLSDGGTYHGIVQFQQWSDSSGGGAHQLGFTDNNSIWHRASSGGLTTWSSWVKLLNSGNYNSYAPTLTGGGASGTWGINVTGTSGSISGYNNPTTSATANTIAYRDSGADLYARYFMASYQNSSDDVSTGTITYIMAKFGDNYHRSATAAKVASFISGQSMNIVGSASTITGTYSGTLTSSQVTTALGYTPYNSTNPSGYTSNTGTVTSVGGTGTVSGLTLSGTVTTSGNLTLGGTLSLTSGNVTTALGYTPVTSARTLTINGTAFDLSADRSWTISAGTTLNGTGFVKASGTTISYDNSTYYLASNPSGYITSGGRAYPRRSDGGDLNFYWSGQSGQPPWLWGGSDGANMYVYNPSNFSVNYATSSGQVTINYNNDSNSTYQMLWGSGNSVYGTGGIYCNPASDTLYASLFIENSSVRFKENIVDLEGSLDKVIQMRGVKYNKKGTNFNQVGVIAEEVLEILPEVVNHSPTGEVEGVAYARLTAILIEAVKEQQKQIDELKQLLNSK